MSDSPSNKAFTLKRFESKDAILLLDAAGRVLDSNEACNTFFRIDHQQIIGSDLFEHLIPHEEAHTDIYRYPGDNQLLVTARQSDGSNIPVEVNLHPLRHNNSEHYVCILREASNHQDGTASRSEYHTALAQQFFNFSNELMIALDSSGRVTSINDRCCRLLNCQRKNILGRDFFNDFILPDSRKALREAFLTQSDTQNTSRKTVHSSLLDHDGEIHEILWSVAPNNYSNGDLLACGLDVSQHQNTEKQLKVTQENFYNIVEKNRSGILVLDSEGFIRFVNPAAVSMLDRPKEVVIGSNFGRPSLGQRSEMEILRPSGRVGIAEMSVSSTQWQGDSAFLVMLHDISEQKKAEERIQHMAYHDALTGLPNRTLFLDRLQQAILRSVRSGQSLALIFMDLDHFKEVNDSLGHDVGDQLLCEVAQRLPCCVRESDTVARMGGDEFTVLLENLDNNHDLQQIIDKIEECLRHPVNILNWTLSAAASLGISIYPDHGGDANTLLRHADSAMYYTKRNPGIGASIFHPDMEIVSTDRLSLSLNLQNALEQNQFFLEYQPKVSLDTGKPIGMEALLRWRHPHRGIIMPDEFIPLLEDSGGIIPTGDWVLREACAQIEQWNERLPFQPYVAVNISPRQLNAVDLPALLKEIFEEYPLAAPYLHLELTESAVMQNLEVSKHQLTKLRDMGIELHMDDFGTGYSSLSILKNLPYNVVKLDRSFVKDLENDRDSRVLTRAAIAMAHSLNKHVIAEGVETDAQLRFLHDLGCETGQGWLFSKSVEAQHIPWVAAILG